MFKKSKILSESSESSDVESSYSIIYVFYTYYVIFRSLFTVMEGPSERFLQIFKCPLDSYLYTVKGFLNNIKTKHHRTT